MSDLRSRPSSVRRLVPNTLTVARVPIGLVGAWASIDGRGALAAWLYLIGYLTDVADGWSARALGVSSPQGRRLDGLADVAFHALFGAGIAARAADDEMWWVVGVLVALVVGERLMRRWVGSHTVVGKAIAGVYRIVMFMLLLAFTAEDRRVPLIVADLVVVVSTYFYEGTNTLRELRSGERGVR